MFKRALTLICCTLLFAVFSVRADQWNKKTVVTFNRPVELPGIVLPAGKYVFKLLDSSSDRHIVQVFNADESKIFATILAIPNYRLEPTGDTVLRFAERARDLPEALRAWFFPGDNFGQEFVYPKVRAMSIAAELKAPVLAAEVAPQAKEEELVKAPVETIVPPREEAMVEAPEHWAQPEPTAPAVEPEPAPVPAPVPAAPPLPATASPFPVIALLGVCSLALAAWLKRVVAA
jgi:hypothetical protein